MIVGGGDVRFDLLHMFDHSINGARVDGGTLHLVNQSSWIAYDQTFPVYQIYFGTNAGTPGKISEVICCSATSGVHYSNPNPANPVKAWVNFPLTIARAQHAPRTDLATIAGQSVRRSEQPHLGVAGRHGLLRPVSDQPPFPAGHVARCDQHSLLLKQPVDVDIPCHQFRSLLPPGCALTPP